jgi:hypothetical protein
MMVNGVRYFDSFYFTRDGYFSGILLLLFLACSLFPARADAADKPADELDARFSWTIRWEEEAGTGKTQQKGSCTIQMSGKIVKYQEDEDEDDSEFLVYRPKGMNASYKYNNKWYNIEPSDECYGLIAEEDAFGSVKIKGGDEITGPDDGMFELQAFLGYGGQIGAMQWLAQVSPEKMMDIDKQPSNDNYTFMLNVPFKTQIQAREDCINIEPSFPRMFGFQLLIYEYEKMGMSGAFDHTATAPTFQQLGYGSCCGVTRYLPSEGSYNTISSVSWTFGKVATLQILFWDKDTEEWVNVNDEPVYVIAGEQVKLRAKVLPEDKDPKKGEWVIDGNDNKNYIKEFRVAEDHTKSEVIPLQNEDLKQAGIEFYWFKGNKGSVRYSTRVDGKEYSKEVEFTIRNPEYTVKWESREDNHFGTMTDGDPKLNAKWPNENRVDPEYKGKLGKREIVEGLQYQGILFYCESGSDIPGETQWVQLIENCQRSQEYDPAGELRSTPPIDKNCEQGLDMAYPCARNNSFYDAPGIPTSILPQNYAYKRVRMTLNLYLMFKPEGEENEWIPLKRIDWKWDGAVAKEKEKWKPEKDPSFVPKDKDPSVYGKDPTVIDATEYPLWDKIVGK